LAESLKESDVVIGSRYVGGIRILNWSYSRMFLSVWANRYVRAILRLPYTDCTSGFRGYRREALEAIPWKTIRASGYAFLVELLYMTVLNGCRVCEAPIIYTERRAGQSKMSRRDIWEAFWYPWALLARGCFRRHFHSGRRAT
jgi:dolichol-phosphate mannosyltransferase